MMKAKDKVASHSLLVYLNMNIEAVIYVSKIPHKEKRDNY